MTSEKNLTEEFFRVFGIEPEYTYIGHYPLTDEKGIIQPPKYLEITDHKLLQMICVLSQWDADNYYQILANNMQDLKNEILNDCINFKQKLKNKYFDAQIQQLFKD